jgi:DNA invertase Pin-like site-specific DNA recombinase
MENRTLVVEKLDRLTRDLMIQEHIIQDLRDRGITVVSVAEPDLCSHDPTRELLRQIMGAIRESSSMTTSLRNGRTDPLRPCA